jgi:Uma2 family endonuclease
MATLATVRELVSAEDPVPATMSEAEYLRTTFRPDCDFVDGRIEERNVGEWEHAWVQKALMRIFLANEAGWGVNLIQECRLQVAGHRFRVPDSMVLRADQKVQRIMFEAPLICIEVISPEDTWKRLTNVLGDYLAMGVKHVWAFDPAEKKAYRFDADGFHPVTGQFHVDGTTLVLKVDDVFLDQPAG